jgi:hypothetical protein
VTPGWNVPRLAAGAMLMARVLPTVPLTDSV